MIKSLLLKDYYNLRKSTLLIIAIDVFLYSIVFLPSSGPVAYTMISVVMLSAVSITSFIYDDNSGWETYALATPISRRDLLLSKFLLIFIYTLIGLIIGLAVSAIWFVFNPNALDIWFYLPACLLIFCYSLDMGSLYLYVISKFGLGSSKLLIIGFYVVPILVISLIINLLVDMGIVISERQIMLFILVQPLITVLITWLSYHFSYKEMLKKDY